MSSKIGRESDKFMLRLPDGMRDRIKAAAEVNGRSMNAEIVATLHEKYPPKGIDVDLLSEFLESLIGISAPDGNSEYFKVINEALAKSGKPWTVKSGWDGAVSFYPYATKTDDDEDKASRSS